MHHLIPGLGLALMIWFLRRESWGANAVLLLGVVGSVLSVMRLDRRFPFVRPASVAWRLRRRFGYLTWPMFLLVVAPVAWWQGERSVAAWVSLAAALFAFIVLAALLPDDLKKNGRAREATSEEAQNPGVPVDDYGIGDEVIVYSEPVEGDPYRAGERVTAVMRGTYKAVDDAVSPATDFAITTMFLALAVGLSLAVSQLWHWLRD